MWVRCTTERLQRVLFPLTSMRDDRVALNRRVFMLCCLVLLSQSLTESQHKILCVWILQTKPNLRKGSYKYSSSANFWHNRSPFHTPGLSHNPASDLGNMRLASHHLQIRKTSHVVPPKHLMPLIYLPVASWLCQWAVCRQAAIVEAPGMPECRAAAHPLK